MSTVTDEHADEPTGGRPTDPGAATASARPRSATPRGAIWLVAEREIRSRLQVGTAGWTQRS